MSETSPKKLTISRDEIRAIYGQGEDAVIALVEGLLERIAVLEERVEALENQISKNGCELSEATLYTSRESCFAGLASVESAIATQVQPAEVLHCDETGMRVKGTLVVACCQYRWFDLLLCPHQTGQSGNGRNGNSAELSRYQCP